MGYSIEISKAKLEEILSEIKQLKEIKKERELTDFEDSQLNHKIKIAVALRLRLEREGKI